MVPGRVQQNCPGQESAPLCCTNLRGLIVPMAVTQIKIEKQVDMKFFPASPSVLLVKSHIIVARHLPQIACPSFLL